MFLICRYNNLWGDTVNFRYKLMQFMSGRYGIDKLSYFLLFSAVALSFVNCFVYSWILRAVVSAMCFYVLFRTLSRNIYARSRENQKFEGILYKVRNYRNTCRQRKADFTHIYKKCPYCRAVLRLPRRKGKHTTVCPKCSKSFRVKVWRDYK